MKKFKKGMEIHIMDNSGLVGNSYVPFFDKNVNKVYREGGEGETFPDSTFMPFTYSEVTVVEGIRVGEVDKEKCVQVLKNAYAEEYLTFEQFKERLDALSFARTASDVNLITCDLPVRVKKCDPSFKERFFEFFEDKVMKWSTVSLVASCVMFSVAKFLG